MVHFLLNGCDIQLVAEAPEDITLRELLTQCDRIKPLWCACGICSLEAAGMTGLGTDVYITKENVVAADGANCTIK
jgi:hypothetical protein